VILQLLKLLQLLQSGWLLWERGGPPGHLYCTITLTFTAICEHGLVVRTINPSQGLLVSIAYDTVERVSLVTHHRGSWRLLLGQLWVRPLLLQWELLRMQSLLMRLLLIWLLLDWKLLGQLWIQLLLM
jgi:hypothetical protein